MQKKKIIIIVVGLIIVIGGLLFYKNIESYKQKEQAKKQGEMKNIATEKTSNEKLDDKSKEDVGGNNIAKEQNVQSNREPKMLTKEQIQEKEKEANKAWEIRKEHEKKYTSLQGVRNYLVSQSLNLLIKEFPKEQENSVQIESKLKAIVDETITPEIMKSKFRLNGPEYDLKQIGVDLTPVDDLKFALNINTNRIIENTNKDLAIVPTESAE